MTQKSKSNQGVKSKKGGARKGAGGPRSPYTTQLAHYICERVAMGQSLRSLGDHDPITPCESTMRAWLRPGSPTYKPDFNRLYAQAREARSHARSDAVDDINRRVENGELDHRQAGVMSRNLQWLAERENPTDYGQRKHIETHTTHTVELPNLEAVFAEIDAIRDKQLVDITPDKANPLKVQENRALSHHDTDKHIDTNIEDLEHDDS